MMEPPSDVLLRWTDDEFNIIQKCVKIQINDDEMTGEETAFRQLEIFFPIAEDIGCLSHTIDHVGDKFVTPTLK